MSVCVCLCVSVCLSVCMCVCVCVSVCLLQLLEDPVRSPPCTSTCTGPPLKSVAIDPEYPKKKKNMFITGAHVQKGWGVGRSNSRYTSEQHEAMDERESNTHTDTHMHTDTHTHTHTCTLSVYQGARLGSCCCTWTNRLRSSHARVQQWCVDECLNVPTTRKPSNEAKRERKC